MPVTQEMCDATILRAFEILGKRWNGAILAVLRNGPMKFSDVRRGLGRITDSVLSDRLEELTHANLVARTCIPGRPPRITYELTAKGKRLQPILDDLGAWIASPDA